MWIFKVHVLQLYYKLHLFYNFVLKWHYTNQIKISLWLVLCNLIICNIVIYNKVIIYKEIFHNLRLNNIYIDIESYDYIDLYPRQINIFRETPETSQFSVLSERFVPQEKGNYLRVSASWLSRSSRNNGANNTTQLSPEIWLNYQFMLNFLCEKDTARFSTGFVCILIVLVSKELYIARHFSVWVGQREFQ